MLFLPIYVVSTIIYERYVDVSYLYFQREDYSWVLQTAAIFLFLVAKGYGIINITVISILSYFPLGYRIIAFMIPMQVPRYVNGNRDIVIAMAILMVSPLKLYSYADQSIKNDEQRSVIIHYEDLLK